MSSKTTDLPTFMSSSELAELCNVSLGTVHGWRHRNIGPPGYKIGGALRYRYDEVMDYLDTCRLDMGAAS